ncbi:hypothetical protein C5167_049611 [Papaver somniferum]|uniref:3-hydroxyisobutyryl-CoA hydrolase n=1 Tax=Papaver somniferum TaxID=3469 RepID=A0A4Y7KP61_PAPSO|nr:hypothetical protein C5167_049611 [Papaver somniferum]
MVSANSSNGATDQVLVEEKSSVRTLILNRPRQLNALSFPMISPLLELFIAYEDDPNVKLVILKGQGRAFCAGGDVAAVANDPNMGATFFWKEYTLNYMMATYKKIQVSILDGIVMGGGAGASVHGEYAGLTGARLDGSEMLACGLATHYVPSVMHECIYNLFPISEQRLSSLEDALCKANSADQAIVSAIIDEFSEKPTLKEKSAYQRLGIIDRCFSRRTVEEILSALERETVRAEDWIFTAIQSLKKASPTSLKISLKAIREGRLQGVGQCLIQEYRMCCHVLRKEVSKDFFEGCRAILIDKDRNPKWEPSRLELVSDEMVNRYFLKVDDKDWEDLVLPIRDNLPAAAFAKL